MGNLSICQSLMYGIGIRYVKHFQAVLKGEVY